MSVTEAKGEPFTPPANLKLRRFWDNTFVVWGVLATALGLFVLGALLVDLFHDGAGKLTSQFFLSFATPEAATSGILAAWVGSVLVMITTALICIPLGVAAGLYLEEYAKKNWITDIIEITVNNLAGVPSIIYGLLGLGLFVNTLSKYSPLFGQTILTAGLTLSLLILPVIIVATRESVRGVPRGIREAALAVGATRWQATQHHVLPYSIPGIVTGVIIGMSRALGETAPLIVIGVPTFVAFLPFVLPSDVGQSYYDADGNEVITKTGDMLMSWLPWAPDGQGWLGQAFTVTPIQMFNWTSRPDPAFLQNAAAAGIVLLVITLVMNGTAIYLRYNLRKSVRW
jgi:phosphate transport system permease protein